HLQKFGIIVSGVMDNFAARTANILVGNEEDEAMIEMMMYGTKLLVQEDAIISITGGNSEPHIDDIPIPMWRPVYVQKGSIISFPYNKTGLLSYIAFSGGLNIPQIFGSTSTYMGAEIGGYKGRNLQKNDNIPLKNLSNKNIQIKTYIKKLQNRLVPWFIPPHHCYPTSKMTSIRVMSGKEFKWFKNEGITSFFNETFTITPQSNRM